MGLGGNLMWTPLAYEIYKKTGKIVVFINNKKIVDDKNNLWKNLNFIYDNSKNNLNYNDLKNNENYFLIDMNIRPDLNKNGQPNIIAHTINSRCSHFGYYNIEPKIYMKFTQDEEKYIKNILKKLPKKFIVIEPHAKTSWCEHKQYPLKKWQNIINSLYKKIPIVQMSLPSNEVLNNVINIGKDIKNFRQACLLLKYAKMFVSSEGGLMHGAKVHNTKCVMIYCPMFDPIWTKYNNVTCIWVKDKNHFNCFKDGTCKKCLEIMNNHNENIIINKIKNNLD
tara:strand:- start:276 stop:1115 length:840 start_codon:yes stop_codon:yes gene_type:complete